MEESFHFRVSSSTTYGGSTCPTLEGDPVFGWFLSWRRRKSYGVSTFNHQVTLCCWPCCFVIVGLRQDLASSDRCWTHDPSALAYAVTFQACVTTPGVRDAKREPAPLNCLEYVKNKTAMTTKSEGVLAATDRWRVTIIPGDVILFQLFLPGHPYLVFQDEQQPSVKLNYTAFPHMYFMIY